MSDYTKCFACGAPVLNIEGDCHAYMLAAPGCWAMFTEVMEREYSDARFQRGHQFAVDAYACQHVGQADDQRAINSVYIHLAALYSFFEKGLSQAELPVLRNKFSQYYKDRSPLTPLEPPPSFGPYTVFDLWDKEDPNLLVEITKKWAAATWYAWAHQHERIAALVQAIY